MADNAEKVIIALEARNGQFNTDIRRSDVAFGQSMTAIERSATRAEGTVQKTAQGIVNSARSVANSQRNLGRQIADVGVGLASGQSPFLIIAQQSAQVADALADGNGKAAAFARVLSGPVGAAALGPATVARVLDVDRALDAFAFIPFCIFGALLTRGRPIVLFQLLKQPIPTDLWPTWPMVRTQAGVIALVMAIALGVTVAK